MMRVTVTFLAALAAVNAENQASRELRKMMMPMMGKTWPFPHFSPPLRVPTGKKGKKRPSPNPAKGNKAPPAKGSSDPYVPRPTCAEVPAANGVALDFLCTVYEGNLLIEGMMQYLSEDLQIGGQTALIPEANDAEVLGAPVIDGMSGDIQFPFGALKPLATVGEKSICPGDEGKIITGVPDGVGAYLIDDVTVRVIVQSESYGPLRFYTVPFPVNDGAASFTGSHVQYVDYDRMGLSTFMDYENPASDFVVGSGEVIKYAYNLKGELVGPRNREGPTEVGAHFGNTDAAGNYVIRDEIDEQENEADWFYQSFCSAHLEEVHQWGPGIGVEDNLYMTNEEWNSYADGSLFTGIGPHAVDLKTDTAWAVGSMSLGGFEKITEMNPQHPDYVMFAMAGYNGDFSGTSAVLDAKNALGKRPDGSDWVWTENIVPFRMYVGVKGKMEDGSDAHPDDFLARNGLRYGKIYGYAINRDMSTEGLFRDDFHKRPDLAFNGAHVPGKWIAQDWQWDGEVRDFTYDGSWDFQVAPAMEGMDWWVAGSYDGAGAKTEHCSPDPRPSVTGFVQGSTAGYFGHLYVNEVAEALAGGLPEYFDGSYHVYQGELDVSSQIELGGAGVYATVDGVARDATRNYDTVGDGKATFEDIDGLEIVMGTDHKLYAILQEDSGNDLGERMFITQALEHENDGHELTYYFMAMSGGGDNTRMAAGVSVPANTSCGGASHEFSGVFDLSGLLLKDHYGDFVVSASDTGSAKREAEAMVDINDKYIIVNLQAHNLACGIIDNFDGDRGGQWLLYKPDIPY